MKMRTLLLVLCVSILGCSQPQKSSEEVTLWHWMTDRHEVLEQLAQQYQSETGITVKVDLFAPSDAYTQRIIASAQARTLAGYLRHLRQEENFCVIYKKTVSLQT